MAESRKKKWSRLLQEVRDRVEELREVYQEIQDDFDEMSERSQEGPRGERMQTFLDEADLDPLEGELDTLEAVEVP